MSDTETPASSDAPAGLDGRAPAADDHAFGTDDAVNGSTADPDGGRDTAGRDDGGANQIAPTVRLTRRGRVRKWDRPPPPHDWRWFVGHLGRTLIALGVLMFGFVAYQLWGTGLETAAAQRALEDDFEELLATSAPVVVPDEALVDTASSDANAVTADDPTAESDPVGPTEPEQTSAEPAPEAASETPVVEDENVIDENGVGPDRVEEAIVEETAVAVEDQNIPLVDNGDAIARIEIPRIGVNDIVVAGVENGDLKKGPGHFPDTPLPGQLGNAAIAGHRTTYGQPFHDIDDLEPGDEIRVTTLNGVFVYRVTGQEIVSPSDYQVVATTDATVANLTLTSCHPKWSASQRIVIFSELDRTESAPVGAPVLNYGRQSEPPAAAADEAVESPAVDDEVADEPAPAISGTATGNLVDEPVVSAPAELTSAAVNDGIADAFAEGWFSDPGANPQVGMWGLALIAIAVAAYLISRRLRRDWVGLFVGVLPFVVALYFFFQNVNRLLPPNL